MTQKTHGCIDELYSFPTVDSAFVVAAAAAVVCYFEAGSCYVAVLARLMST